MVYQKDSRWASLHSHGKQPLVYWVYGFVSQLTGQPFQASKIVSILLAIASYFVVSMYTKKSLMHLAVFTFAPLFIHFQTLALQESFVILETLLVFFLTDSYGKHKKSVIPVLLGLVYSAGLWTKTTMLIPILLSILTFKNFLPIFLSCSVALLFTLPLIMQKDIHAVISDPGVFTMTTRKIFTLLFSQWFYNIKHVAVSMLLYLGPVAIWFIYTTQTISKYRSGILTLVPVSINKIMSARYYVYASIPLLTVKHIPLPFVVLTVVWGLYFTLFPKTLFGFFPFGSEREYAYSWTSGYVYREMDTFITATLPDPSVLIFPDRPGNPTDYFIAKYYNSNRFFTFIYHPSINSDALPLYYITRSSVPMEKLPNSATLIHKITIDEKESLNLFSLQNKIGEP